MRGCSDERLHAIEIMLAWHEARQASKPGSREYREYDKSLQAAATAFRKLEKNGAKLLAVLAIRRFRSAVAPVYSRSGKARLRMM